MVSKRHGKEKRTAEREDRRETQRETKTSDLHQ
jgi:hypothetical protein